jgi:hypothetical protein
MTKIDTTASAHDIAAAIIARAKARSEKGVRKEIKANAEPAPKAKMATKKATKPLAKKESKDPVVKTPKEKKEGPLCLCGCGDHTKGGKYKPGHDARHKSAQAGPKVAPLCGCGCGVQTKGGKFLPGHDARYHSALLKAEKESAAKKAKNDIPMEKKPKATKKVKVVAQTPVPQIKQAA